jgi:hypothetical protein
MIWQEQIGVIVMLANVYEDGKVGQFQGPPLIACPLLYKDI